ncbi:MAG TPA: YihY/virulence factor BrkB family protein [bacterium]|nr:YihY/virulence factor BrkB family protein [bacterium]
MISRAVTIVKHVKGWWDAYVRKDFTNKSASLSFFTIISIVPLVLVLVTLLGHLVPQDVLVRETVRLMEQFFPLQNPVLLKTIGSLFAKRRTFGWFGLVTLLFSSRLLYLNLEHFVNDLLKMDRRRNYFLRRLFFLIWVTAGMLVLLTPLLLGGLRKSLGYFGFDIPGIFASKGAFLLLSFLMFLIVMLVLPTRRIPIRRAAVGGVMFSGALTLGQWGFKALTARSVSQYNVVYGSLASLILGAVWIFYFYQLFLVLIYWTGRNLKDVSQEPPPSVREDYAPLRKKKSLK